MKKRSTPFLAIGFLIVVSLPIFAIKSHHNCMYDECYCIYYDGGFGVCVENAINNIYKSIAVLWYPVIMISCMVLSKYKTALSPFVVIVMLIALSIWGAFIDPAKWMFVVSLLPSTILLIVASIIDNHKTEKTKKLTP